MYDASYNKAVTLAIGSATVLFVVTLLLVLAIVYLRISLGLRQQHTKIHIMRWQPRLAMAILSLPKEAPKLTRDDSITFLALWNHAQESFRGDVKEQLNELARLAGADRVALAFLKSRRTRKRLMGITALGHLREHSAWDELVDVAHSDNAALSLSAMRALLHINALAALPVLIPLLQSRDDWPAPRVANILHEAGPEIVSTPLAGAALRAPPDEAPRLIRYLENAYLAQVSGTLGHLLRNAEDDRVISACLQVLPDPLYLDDVREFTKHSRWHVRLHAARALGRLGTHDDIPRLTELLGDEQWWVRYRSAQALAGMPGMTRERLEQIREEQTDAFARDILTHVMAERSA